MENQTKSIFKNRLVIISGAVILLGVIAYLAFLFLPFGSSKTSITHIPFKESKNGRWGFIDVKGEVVVSEEFKNMPGYAYDGIARVRNEKDKFEFYKIDKKPQQIGSTYVNATDFSEGMALVAEEFGYIKAINPKGETLFELSPVGESEIVGATRCHDGMIAFVDPNDKIGYLNKKGEVAVKPTYISATEYSNGVARVVDEDNRIHFIDKKGEKIYTVKAEVWCGTLLSKNEFLYTDAAERTDDEEKISFGIMDFNGEKKINANNKYKYLTNGVRDQYIYLGEEKSYGIIDKKGEQIVRAKYDNIVVFGKQYLAVKKDGEEMKAEVLDVNGNTVSKRDCDDIAVINDFLAVKDGSEWEFCKSDLKKFAKKTTVELGDLGKSKDSESDYLNWSNLQKVVLKNIKSSGVDGIGVSSGVKSVERYLQSLNKLDSKEDKSNDKKKAANKLASWNIGLATKATVKIFGADEVYYSLIRTQEKEVSKNNSGKGYSDSAASESDNKKSESKQSSSFKDNFPEYTTYQRELSSDYIRGGGFNYMVSVTFSDYIKEAVYSEVREWDDFWEMYFTSNRLTGYKLANVDVSRVTYNIGFQKFRNASSIKKLKEEVEKFLTSAGFSSQDDYFLGNGCKASVSSSDYGVALNIFLEKK
jgi:hypothetical protein